MYYETVLYRSNSVSKCIAEQLLYIHTHTHIHTYIHTYRPIYIPYLAAHKTQHDFFLRNFRKKKNNDECILILVINWKGWVADTCEYGKELSGYIKMQGIS